MDWLRISQIFQQTLVGIGVIIGGVWAVYQLLSQRTHAAALEIEIVATTTPREDDHFLVFVDVSLKNVGRRKIDSNRKRNDDPSKPVYEDEVEKLHHSLDLQVRRMPEHLENLGPEWHLKLPLAQNVPPEINLLYEYQYTKDGKENFWMEPGETYHFGYPLLLKRGDYLIKVTFLGPDADNDFWRRVFYLPVPPANTEFYHSAASPLSPSLPHKLSHSAVDLGGDLTKKTRTNEAKKKE